MDTQTRPYGLEVRLSASLPGNPCICSATNYLQAICRVLPSELGCGCLVQRYNTLVNSDVLHGGNTEDTLRFPLWSCLFALDLFFS